MVSDQKNPLGNIQQLTMKIVMSIIEHATMKKNGMKKWKNMK